MTLLFGLICLGLSVFLLSYHYNKRFVDWIRFQSIGTRDYVVDRLSQMFFEMDPQRVLIIMFSMSAGLGSLVFLAFLPDIVPGIVFGIIVTAIGWKAPKPIIDFIYQKRVEKFSLQMVDGLGLMANGLKSGLSITQSMSLVTREMPNPIRQEFDLILSENKLGVSLEESFNNLARRVQSDDVEMFVTAVNILKETGGNLAETFDTIVTTIRERIRVEKRIKTLTTQPFIQGMVVMLLVPAMAVIFHQMDPGFMRPLYTTTIGWMIVVVIMALVSAGFFIIMKIIKIDV